MLAEKKDMENFEGAEISIQERFERLAIATSLETPSDIEIAEIRLRPGQEDGSVVGHHKAPQKSVTEALVICRDLAVAERFVGIGGANIRGDLMKWAEEYGKIDLYFICRNSDHILEIRALFDDIIEEYAQNLNTLAPKLMWCDLGTYQPIGKLIEDRNPKILLDRLGEISYSKHSADAMIGPIACWPLDDYLLDRTTDQDFKALKPTEAQSIENEELPHSLQHSLKLKAALGGVLIICWAGMFCALAAVLAVGDSLLLFVFGAFALLGWIVLKVGSPAATDER